MFKDKRIEDIDAQTGKLHLAATEASRLSTKYCKEFFDCKDLMVIMGIGRDNARALMRSEDFPTISVGNRKVVSILSFVLWQLRMTA